MLAFGVPFGKEERILNCIELNCIAGVLEIHSFVYLLLILGFITSVIERCYRDDTSSGLGRGGDISHTVLGHDRIVESNDGAIVAPMFLPRTHVHTYTLFIAATSLLTDRKSVV